MFPVLRTILLDRGRHEREAVQRKEFAGIGSELRGNNASSQIFVDRGSRDAEPLCSSACAYDSRWLFHVPTCELSTWQPLQRKYVDSSEIEFFRSAECADSADLHWNVGRHTK